MDEIAIIIAALSSSSLEALKEHFRARFVLKLKREAAPNPPVVEAAPNPPVVEVELPQASENPIVPIDRRRNRKETPAP